ncbi:hypothetical protein V865_007976 [Kwoniella europaea PYCC6329]|uniref:WSC domain-containing protein n=1 Tax=Kwoniella europaea PYCC6329 TaxID=1423913 RepID=A0AAX4KWT5_9TREE
MAFFGGLSGWSGSSWSPWSGLGSDSDSDTDTVTTTTQVAQTSTSTPSPSTATATVVQQVTTTAVSVVTPSTTASTSKAVTVTQTSKPASSAIPSTTAQDNAQTSQQQQQQQSQVSQVGSSSIAGAQSSSSTSRPSSSAAATSSSSTNSAENVGDIPDDWTYFGCVPNNNGMPALNTTYATSDELTPVLCITACAASQYHYAGLQNGNACFCGSTITTPSISSSSSSCNMNCTGDPSGSSKCGGSSSMSFYHLRSIDPNSSSSPNSSSTSIGLDGQYGDSGSGTVVVSLPEFTGTLMEYGDPRFRSGKDGVIFGEMFKVSSSSSSRYRPDLNTKLEGLASLVLLGWVGLRILR